MAIIYSYPDIGDVQGNDIIVITDADTGNATKSATIDTLSAYIAAQAGALVQAPCKASVWTLRLYQVLQL
jgi:hypothetical protein